jgi:hypothetical protein
MDVLLGRDPTYRKAMAGEVKNVPGVDDPYEPPTHADVTVHSDQERTEEAALRLFQALVDLKYLAPAEFGRLTGGQRPKRARPAKHGKRARKPRGREEPAARPGARPASKKAAARAPAPRRLRKR